MHYQPDVLWGGLLSLGCRVPKSIRKFKVGASMVADLREQNRETVRSTVDLSC